jgi:putative RNA 2'-phosphotransferase
MKQQLVATSKFLSLVLRHRPDVIGIELDVEGWVSVEDLLAACAQHGRAITREQLDAVVRTNDKQRFALSADGSRMRANQGHSLPIDLGLVPVEPPELLYHGTVPRFLESIRRDGLTKGNRHHVHLSPDIQTATKVGQRRGRPIVLVVAAGRMFRDGHKFYRSENGVWLTDSVPPGFLRE